jgi:hypothetical protein
MPTLLAAVETTVPPDDAQIFVVAGAPDEVPVLGGTDGRFVGCGPDVIVITSESQLLHEAAVRLESWDEEPPAPGGDWDDVQSGRLSVSEDSIAVGGLWESDISDRLPLRTDGWHHVRVYTGGRAALRAWDAQWDGGDAPVGLERFVVQLWPEAVSASPGK